MHILHTVSYTFPEVMIKRICVTIKSLNIWWSFPLLSWLWCMIQGWYCEEKLAARQPHAKPSKKEKHFVCFFSTWDKFRRTCTLSTIVKLLWSVRSVMMYKMNILNTAEQPNETVSLIFLTRRSPLMVMMQRIFSTLFVAKSLEWS